MARRTKRVVKQRAKAHQKIVNRERKRRKHSKRKVRYGAKLRRARKARQRRK